MIPSALALVRLALGLLALGLARAAPAKAFVNDELRASADLTSTYLRYNVRVTASNVGAEPASRYWVPVPANVFDNLAAVEARDAAGEPLAVSLAADPDAAPGDAGVPMYVIIELADAVAPKSTVSLSYAFAVLDAVRPLPAKAAQSDQQLFVYEGSRTVLSAYDTKRQTLTLKTVTQQVVDLETGQSAGAEAEPGRGGLVQFGPFKNVRAGDSKPLRLQYEHPLPQIRYKNLNRKIWISHWGQTVSFDESYDLYNGGTQLNHAFSRLAFMRPGTQSYTLNHAAVQHIPFNLPPKSRELYFVDLVGNVSTSRVVAPNENRVILDVNPRYPVMGGWHYNFTIGWANPLGEFVHRAAPGKYVAKFPVVYGSDDSSYDYVSTEIILPEGATNIAVDGDSGHGVPGTVFSYLDSAGRPSRTLVYSKLVSEHRDSAIIVTYDYSSASALRKPLLYVGYFVALFAAAFVVTSLDFSVRRRA